MSALASYARQTNDSSLFDYAVEIRNRARRRMGEMLRETDKQTGAHLKKGAHAPVLGRTAVASGAGIKEHDRKAALRIAAMPEAEFERRVREPDLGQKRGEPKAFITCPHCGKKIIR